MRPFLLSLVSAQAYLSAPCSAGLEHARRFLEPIKEKHPWITYADLWTLAGVVAVKEMGGPDVKWKPGRTDFVDDSKVCPSPVLLFSLLAQSGAF